MDRLIRITTALAVVAVALVAAVISYQHAFELVRAHGEVGVTARLLPFTVDGLIWAASMAVWTPAATTAGGVEPRCRDLRHGRREPGTRGWGTGQLGHWSAPEPPWRWSATRPRPWRAGSRARRRSWRPAPPPRCRRPAARAPGRPAPRTRRRRRRHHRRSRR